MSGQDNLLAGLSGAAGAASDILSKIIEDKIRRRGNQEDLINKVEVEKELQKMKYDSERISGQDIQDILGNSAAGINIKSDKSYNKDLIPLMKNSAMPTDNAMVDVIDKATGKVVGKARKGSITVGETKANSSDINAKTKAKDQSIRTGIELIKNYYSRLSQLQGENDPGVLGSAKLGATGMVAKTPILGRALSPELSDLDAFRKSQGASLAKAAGDSGNIALVEQENALKILAPPGTRDLKRAEATAITRFLEGATAKTEEEKQYLNNLKSTYFGRSEFSSEDEKRLRELERKLGK